MPKFDAQLFKDKNETGAWASIWDVEPKKTASLITGDSNLEPPFGEEDIRQNLYKTELCRSFVETGVCRYGHKCQFAHGSQDLRPVARHPKYKTEICKTFSTTGQCPYGNRCRFIHTGAFEPEPEIQWKVASNEVWSQTWLPNVQNIAKKKTGDSLSSNETGKSRLAVFQTIAH
eukprot:TRINITY_DN14087_c0_g1_i1.p1 TRINITY_DN14087_c0_g1~~TRINITY_DN14087_c0_g1_i1.p1  ORF type:complete len:174 (-),score=33.05 TRINITY_DN14087_c0_g1_i1:72-593(-)